MLITKQKREPRRARQHTAWWLTFDDDFVSHECQVLDVSLNGAKLIAEIGVKIGNRFRLSTVPHAVYVSDAKWSGAAAKCSASSL
jgi:hypothetical protein